MATPMSRYPHTTAGSILLLGAAIMFTGAVYVRRENETVALAIVSLLFAIGGLTMLWSRESSDK